MRLRRTALLALGAASVALAQTAPPPQPAGPPPVVKTPKRPMSRAQQAEVKEQSEALEPLRAVPPKFTWDIPEVVERVEVPGLVEGLGTPVKLHAVRTKWKLAEIMDFMAREFRQARLYIPPPEHITRLSSDPQLHGYDPFRQIGFSVIFQPNRDGSTTLILGEAHVSEGKPVGGNYFVPLHPNAQGAIQSEQEGSMVLAFSTTASQAEVEKFYAEVLPQQGYQQLSAGRFRKGGEQVVVSYYQPTAGMGSSVVLTRGRYQPEQVDMSKSPAEVVK